jgi:uncharacterized protein (DUF736 family)
MLPRHRARRDLCHVRRDTHRRGAGRVAGTAGGWRTGSADRAEEAPTASVVLGRSCRRSPQAASLLGWSGAGPAWACNGSADLLPLGFAHSSRTNKLGCRRPALALRSCGCRRPGRRLATAIEAAWGGFGQLAGETTMAQIGTFIRDENGAYAGTIKTLTLNVKATIKPCDRDNDKAPDYRVTANGVEFGAGWSRAARETGAEYLSLKLDDPSFTAPVYASLVQGDKGEHKLIWSR